MFVFIYLFINTLLMERLYYYVATSNVRSKKASFMASKQKIRSKSKSSFEYSHAWKS